jgi:peptidoglycan hydrolase-like protein with peptidoglycan-binding domain
MATLRYQRSVNITADAKWGAGTDTKAFPVIVPPTPTPTPPPVGQNLTKRPNADIQTFLTSKGFYSGPINGAYDAATTAAVTAYQKSWFITADGIWGATSDGLAFPPAGSTFGVDYSFSRPDPAVLQQRGVKVAGRYLWPAQYNSKGITRAEYDGLVSHGITVFFIYEEDGKELTSFAAGVRVAQAAEAELGILGLPNMPIYFNVDYAATAADMPGIMAALDGIASVIGLARTGLYSGLAPIKAAFDAGKITRGFQTYGWSVDPTTKLVVWDPRAQIQQWSNGQWGGSVDFLRTMVNDFGQNPVTPAPDPDPDPTPDPDPVPVPPIDETKRQAILDALDVIKGLVGDL